MSTSPSTSPPPAPSRPSRPSFDAAASTRAISPPVVGPNAADKLKQMSFDTPIDQVQVLRMLFKFMVKIKYVQLWMKEPITRDEVLARNIPWDGYVRGALVSEQDMALIRAFDKKDQNIKTEILLTVCLQWHAGCTYLTRTQTST